MSLMGNIASFIRDFLSKNNMSMAKLQELLDISRGVLYAYGRGEGNPTIAMIELIAKKLDVDPILIMMGVYAPDGIQVSVLLINTVKSVAELPQEEQQRFMQLFIVEMMKLWDRR